MMAIRLKPICCGLLFSGVLFAVATAAAMQDDGDWRLIRVKTYEDVPVEKTRLVTETAYETETVRSSKPVWQTETRQRRIETYKPVQVTRERTERRTVYKPVEVTKYRERQVEEVDYQEVVKYRDEEYTVEVPVTETRMRQQEVTVRKPVTETMIEVNRTTAYKPVTESTTEYVAQPGSVELAAVADPWARQRLRFLRPGYYIDPVTGISTYRRPGLHWVQPTAVVPVASAPPSLVPQQRTETRYIPETVETRRPVERTRMVEETRTEEIPYEVTRYVTETRTRRVPYTTQEPVTRIRTERVPYTETVYEEQVVEETVPHTETVMKKVVDYEPYEIEVQRWVDETKEVQVPKKVQREQTYTDYERVETYKWMKVRVDDAGNRLGEPVELSPEDRLLPPGSATGDEPADRSPALNPDAGEGSVYSGQPTVDDESGRTESRKPADGDQAVPETGPTPGMQRVTPAADNEKTVLETSGTEPAKPEMPAAADSERTGDESAADRTTN